MALRPHLLLVPIVALCCAKTTPDPYAALPIASQFAFAVGAPSGDGYYDAQPFGENHHLGEDWNGKGGGNSDLGDPIHAIGDGQVSVVRYGGPGWGQVVRIVHAIDDNGERRYVESLYAHFDDVFVDVGERVARGDVLGTIGTADGRYIAHLHLELRRRPGLPLGGGYSKKNADFLAPSVFIRARQ